VQKERSFFCRMTKTSASVETELHKTPARCEPPHAQVMGSACFMPRDCPEPVRDVPDIDANLLCGPMYEDQFDMLKVLNSRLRSSASLEVTGNDAFAKSHRQCLSFCAIFNFKQYECLRLNEYRHPDAWPVLLSNPRLRKLLTTCVKGMRNPDMLVSVGTLEPVLEAVAMLQKLPIMPYVSEGDVQQSISVDMCDRVESEWERTIKSGEKQLEEGHAVTPEEHAALLAVAQRFTSSYTTHGQKSASRNCQFWAQGRVKIDGSVGVFERNRNKLLAQVNKCFGYCDFDYCMKRFDRGRRGACREESRMYVPIPDNFKLATQGVSA